MESVLDASVEIKLDVAVRCKKKNKQPTPDRFLPNHL